MPLGEIHVRKHDRQPDQCVAIGLHPFCPLLLVITPTVLEVQQPILSGFDFDESGLLRGRVYGHNVCFAALNVLAL